MTVCVCGGGGGETAMGNSHGKQPCLYQLTVPAVQWFKQGFDGQKSLVPILRDRNGYRYK